MVENIFQTALSLSSIEWLAFFTGFFYIVLAVRENPWCWPWGILSCSLWAYATFIYYDLYLDALLQLFYVALGFIGWYQWKYGHKEGSGLKVSTLPGKTHALIVLFGGLLAFLFGFLFEKYTPAAATYLDALTTVFAIIATLLVVRKVLENWLYWIVVDALYIYLYFTRGALLFGVLYFIYFALSIQGYYSWKKGMS